MAVRPVSGRCTPTIAGGCLSTRPARRSKRELLPLRCANVLAAVPVLSSRRAVVRERATGCPHHGRNIMTATALYRVLADAGANEDLAKEAAESVVYSPEGATKADVAEAKSELQVEIAEFRAELKGDIADLRAETKADIADVKVCIAGLETRIERSLRAMTWRFVGLLLATQALLFAGLRLTGTS